MRSISPPASRKKRNFEMLDSWLTCLGGIPTDQRKKEKKRVRDPSGSEGGEKEGRGGGNGDYWARERERERTSPIFFKKSHSLFAFVEMCKCGVSHHPQRGPVQHCCVKNRKENFGGEIRRRKAIPPRKQPITQKSHTILSTHRTPPTYNTANTARAQSRPNEAGTPYFPVQYRRTSAILQSDYYRRRTCFLGQLHMYSYAFFWSGLEGVDLIMIYHAGLGIITCSMSLGHPR